MSEEELNQELSSDELKDVAGGANINPKQIPKGNTQFTRLPGLGDSFKQQQYPLRNEKKKGNNSSWTEGDWDGNR